MGRRYTRGPFDPFEPTAFQGFREVQIPRPPRRFWVGLGFIGAALLIVLLAAPVVSFITEAQWFAALGLRDVFLTRFALQLWLFLASLGLSFAFVTANVWIALRTRSGRALRAVGIRRRTLWSGAGAVGLAAAAVIALILSGGAGSRWQTLALFMHSTDTGVREPVFGLDVSFYVLRLPFLHDVIAWLFGLFFLTLLVLTGLYAWRGDTFDLRLPVPSIVHISILVGGLALVLAVGAYIDRYDLLFSHNGVVWGVGFADINARVPLAIFRTVLAVALAAVLFANVVIRRGSVIVAAVVAWLVVALVSAIYPALVQRVVVAPAELSQESQYIKREIDFTRRAFAIDKVKTAPYGGEAPITRQDVEADRATVDNLRLWDNKQLQETYQQLQSIRTYYTFRNIDVDRYEIDGKTAQLLISARELDQDRLPQQAQRWVNQKLQYTHGYGVAASPVAAVVGEGLPDYVVKDLPPIGTIKVTRPEVYFGTMESEYVLCPSVQPEFDYPKGEENVRAAYQGSHGVTLEGANRFLWSMRTGDFNMLVSSELTDRTQLLFRRNVKERVGAIAPFLQMPDDPYVVVVDGRIYWIQDTYTVADTYPYSERVEAAGGQNYLRNSVKVVVDAYEGTTDFYVADPTDPIIRAYQATFPSLFKPLDRMPASLQAHLRVPERQFFIQSLVHATYHIGDPAVLYNREDIWAIPQNLEPYYVEMRLPGESRVEYVQMIPFTPTRRQNLVSWLAVRNDAPHYGEMVSFVLPKDKVILGPQQISARIQQTPEISRDRTLLNSQGSSVIDGNLLVVPVGDSFLYFQPWYLKSTTSTQSLPELKKVILTDASTTGLVAYQNTLDQALAQLTGQAAPAPSQPGAPPQPAAGTPPVVADLITQAIQHYKAAQDLLKQGDLAGYAREMNEVGRLLQQADSATKGAPVPSPGASPSPSPRP